MDLKVPCPQIRKDEVHATERHYLELVAGPPRGRLAWQEPKCCGRAHAPYYAGRRGIAARLPCASTESAFHFSHVSRRRAYSARVMGSPPEPKKIRRGGSCASTTFKMAGPVASGSPGTLLLRKAAILSRAGS